MFKHKFLKMTKLNVSVLTSEIISPTSLLDSLQYFSITTKFTLSIWTKLVYH